MARPKLARGKSAEEKVEADKFREDPETANAKSDEQPALDYSAGGIDNATDIITSDGENEDGSLKIVPDQSTRQKD